MFGLPDFVVKLIGIGLLVVFVGGLLAAEHHKIFTEGEAAQVAKDAPVIDLCKSAFASDDVKGCAAAIPVFIDDRKRALIANAELGAQLKQSQDAIGDLKRENDAIVAKAQAALIKARNASAAAKTAIDRYLAVVARPPEPASPAQSEAAKAILRQMVQP